MRKRSKRELFFTFLLLAAIPVIFFTLSAVNCFIIQDLGEAQGFFYSALVATIISSIIFFFEWRRLRAN